MGRLARVATNVGLALVSVSLGLLLCEGVFRVIGIDFAREEKNWRASPVFYRQPTVPTGEVFFRRPGPDEWIGRVVNSRALRVKPRPNPYSGEPTITVRYNEMGFRNPPDLVDWDIAVAGDSFTELGHLRAEDLFTTILGQILHVRVANFGASYTGPLTQLSYLRDFGVSRSTRHAVTVFFEGNDLADLDAEYRALLRWRATGQRDYREFTRQPSFMKAIYQAAVVTYEQIVHPIRPSDYVHAYFKGREGNVRVTLTYAPPGKSDLSKDTLQQLDYFFREYARFGRERRLTVWLAYMPSKERVLYGDLEFTNSAREVWRTWRPTDLPEAVAEIAKTYGIRFIDLTPALVDETRSSGRLVYNSILDSHLNALGSRIVAQELAQQMETARPE